MKLNQLYLWEMETAKGEVLRQYDNDGHEQSWKQLNPDEVIRVSFIPLLPTLPQHDVLIDISNGEKFIKRFGRGFIKQTGSGFKLKEYLNCCVTSNYRFWVFSNGRCMVTRPDYEVYL